VVRVENATSVARATFTRCEARKPTRSTICTLERSSTTIARVPSGETATRLAREPERSATEPAARIARASTTSSPDVRVAYRRAPSAEIARPRTTPVTATVATACWLARSTATMRRPVAT
jgi:hypothetical protein